MEYQIQESNFIPDPGKTRGYRLHWKSLPVVFYIKPYRPMKIYNVFLIVANFGPSSNWWCCRGHRTVTGETSSYQEQRRRKEEGGVTQYLWATKNHIKLIASNPLQLHSKLCFLSIKSQRSTHVYVCPIYHLWGVWSSYLQEFKASDLHRVHLNKICYHWICIFEHEEDWCKDYKALANLLAMLLIQNVSLDKSFLHSAPLFHFLLDE